MTSYQKLKEKCESLESQNDILQRRIDIFKNALTIARTTTSNIIISDREVGIAEKIVIQRSKNLEELERKELSKWVADNLDKETVLKLLEMKKGELEQ